MNILDIMEKLATSLPDEIDVENLINNQSIEIKSALLSQDGRKLKNLLSNNEIMADKDKIVQFYN